MDKETYRNEWPKNRDSFYFDSLIDGVFLVFYLIVNKTPLTNFALSRSLKLLKVKLSAFLMPPRISREGFVHLCVRHSATLELKGYDIFSLRFSYLLHHCSVLDFFSISLMLLMSPFHSHFPPPSPLEISRTITPERSKHPPPIPTSPSRISSVYSPFCAGSRGSMSQLFGLCRDEPPPNPWPIFPSPFDAGSYCLKS